MAEYLTDYPALDEPETERPLDLDEVEAAFGKGGVAAVAEDVPQLLAELREARDELERLRLAGRVEYTLTAGPEPTSDDALVDVEQVDHVHAHPALRLTAWERKVHVGPWTRLSAEAPF